MKKYFKILGLEEGASKEEIEAAYTNLSKNLDPKENDNLDFFIEEYNLVQEAYKKLTGTDDSIPETEKESSKTNALPINIKDISKKIPKNYTASNALTPKEDSQNSNDKPPATEKTNSNKQKNKSPNKNASKPNKNNDPENPKKKRGLKIFLTIIISFILLYSISMFFYSKSKINDAKIYYEKALVRNEVEDFNKAKQDIKIIEDIYQGLIDLPFFSIGYKVFEDSFVLLGDIYINESEYNSAINIYVKALLLNKYNKDIYIKIGDAYVKSGNKNQQAIDNYKKGIKLFKSYDFEKKFIEFYDDKKYVCSVALCEIEINKNPGSFDGYFQMARAYFMLGDNKAAIKQSLISLNIKPREKTALYNHGLYLYSFNNYNEDFLTESVKYLNKSIEQDSEFKIAYLQRGKSYYSLKEYKKAIIDFDKVIQIDPKHALAYSYRGSSNYYLKNYKQAVDNYKKAKSIDSDVYISRYAFENSNKEYNKQVYSNLRTVKRNNSLNKRTLEYNKIKVGDYFKGGIVYDKNYKTLEVGIVATTHSNIKTSYNNALKKANNLSLNDFSDWKLPSKLDLTYISKNHKIINSKGYKSGKFFTKIKIDRYWIYGSFKRYMYVSIANSNSTYTSSSVALSIAVRKYKF